MPSITSEDKKWQAENDARTLMDAHVIMGDQARKKAALAAAKRLFMEKQAEAAAMRAIMKKKA